MIQNPRPSQSCLESQLDNSVCSNARNKKKMILRELISKLVRRLKRRSKPTGSFAQSSGFNENINRGALACFAELCQVLACNNRIQELNLSGCNINIYYAIELANLLQKNSNIEILNLAGCNLSSFSLSCIFKSVMHVTINKMIDHTGLTVLNLFNNQQFTHTTVQDFCKYVLKGKNHLSEINLSYCNIDSYQMSIILPNLKHLKSLKRFKVSMMHFQSESLLALGGAMLDYTGNKSLDYLDISSNRIKSHGIQLLSGALFISVSTINIRGINLSNNCIDQEGVEELEWILLKMKHLHELNLSRNRISEFQNQQFLNMHVFKIDLSFNRIQEIPNNFFLNVVSLNLSNNDITTQGAYQISQILSSKKVLWMELNLANNFIMTKGFISLIYALIENTKLISLSVANNKIYGEGILVYIFNHEQLQLEYLDLSLNRLRYDLVYALITMMKPCRLRTLLLSHLQQEDTQICSGKEDPFQIKCDNLQEIDFSGNYNIISPILESLGNYNRIEFLNLSRCKINQPADISKLARILIKTYTLHTLILSNNNLGMTQEFSLRELENAIAKNSSLISLDLSNNRLKQKIVLLTNGLRQCARLKFLNLRDNQIDENEEINKFLPQLLRNSSLQVLNMTKNSIRTTTLMSMKQIIIKEYGLFPQISLAHQKLSADDLLAIADIISEFPHLKSLDISGNTLIDYMNDVLNIWSDTKTESLSVNKILFRKDTFMNLLSLIHSNRRNLRILEVSNTLLSQNQLVSLLDSLSGIRNLFTLTLDYQVIEKQQAIDSLIQLLPALSNLRHLSVRKSTLTSDFYTFIQILLKESTKLVELDLSDNRISIDAIVILNEGLKQTKTLQILNVSNCKLVDQSFLHLHQGLIKNHSIQELDLSENYMTMSSQKLMVQLFEKSKIRILKVQSNKSNFFINFPLDEHNSIFQHLNRLDLSKNQLEDHQLYALATLCEDSKSFSNVTHLSLESCRLQDQHCKIIKKLITISTSLENSVQLHSTNLRHLNLRKNEITQVGFKEIFDQLLETPSNLEFLDMSMNNIKDTYFSTLPQEGPLKTHKLRLLLLDGNQTTGIGDAGFKQILKQNPQLYIYNEWKGISEELAYQIVESYIIFANNFNLLGQVPYYLSQLHIENSKLTDQFFIWFGTKFFRFPKLEIINFNQSQYITSIGKIFMYSNMISQKYQDSSLQEAYFDDSRQQPTIFDDGIIRCYLIKLKNMLQRPKDNRSVLSQDGYTATQNQTEKIKWGLIGKWMVHIINKNINLVQNFSSTQFRISNSVNQFSVKSFKEIKYGHMLSVFLEIIKFNFSLSLLYEPHQVDPVYYGMNAQCRKEYCILKDFHQFIWMPLVINFSISVLYSALGLINSIRIRRLSKPDYCIITTDMERHINQKFPHKRELILFPLQIIGQTLYFGEFYIFGQSLAFWNYLQDHQHELTNLDGFQSKFLAIMLLIGCIIAYKFCMILFLKLSSVWILFQSTQQFDQATYLNTLWLISENDNNYAISNAIINFCPSKGVLIRETYFNYKQVIELMQAITFELLTLILYLLYSITRQQFYTQMNYSELSAETYMLFFIIITISIIRMLNHIFMALTYRPPEVKVFDFNEALLIRRYEKLGQTAKLLNQRKERKELIQQRNKRASAQEIMVQQTIQRVDAIMDYGYDSEESSCGSQGDPVQIPQRMITKEKKTNELLNRNVA